MVLKVVGERGRRREKLVPLRVGEVIDQDGRVVESEHRLWERRTSWARYRQSPIPTLCHWATVLSLNARSIVNKIEFLRAQCYLLRPDFVFIC